jgi:hypothetical protein
MGTTVGRPGGKTSAETVGSSVRVGLGGPTVGGIVGEGMGVGVRGRRGSISLAQPLKRSARSKIGKI